MTATGGAVVLAGAFNEYAVNPLLTGLFQGAVYGLLGLGLVLLYKGNRIFNFAQGEFGTVAAFSAWALLTGQSFLPKTPYLLAILVGVVVATLMGVASERFVIRPLFRQPKVTIVVATAGIALLAIAVELLLNGTNLQNLRPVSPGAAFSIGALTITKQQVLFLLVLAVLAVLAALFFSRTRTGVAILAVSQEPTATSLVGISVNRISAFTWAMAGALGGLAGVLLAPQSPFAPGFMTTNTLIPSFTAAVLGGMTSLPGAFVGGVSIGIIEQYGLLLPGDIPGANRVAVFAILLLVLLVRPAGLLGKEA